MKRFMTIPLSSEVEIEKIYLTRFGNYVLISAGSMGFDIRHEKFAHEFFDGEDTAEENFRLAYEQVVEKVGPLRELTSEELEDYFKQADFLKKESKRSCINKAASSCEVMAMDVD